MLINSFQTCPDCGSEVELFTDGRMAYGCTVETYSGRLWTQDQIGDTQEVWRDGQSLVLSCPTFRMPDEERCNATLYFNGEGTSATLEGWDSIGQPILDSAPDH